jgi:hypothetical protein
MQKDEQFQEARPGYRLTQPQKDAFNELVRAVDEMTDRMEEAGRPGSQEGQVLRLGCVMLVVWGSHRTG